MSAPAVFHDRRFHDAFAALLDGRCPRLDGDRPAFADWTIRHGLGPYVWSLAKEVDSALRVALDGEAALSSGLVVVREHVLRSLFEAFARAGVVPIVFKGLGVAYGLYARPELRPLGDVDLLVDAAHLERAVRAAEACGFASVNPDPVVQEYYRTAGYNVPLHHPVLNLLELHHTLYRDCQPSFVQSVVTAAPETRLFDQPARMLALADLFVVLATHFCVSDPGVRWLWLLDLALIGGRLTGDDWREIGDAARVHGLQLYVLVVLRMLEGLWSVRVGADVGAELDGTLRWPERLALDALWRRLAEGRSSGDNLVVARRLAFRPVRGGLGVLESLFPHPGAVCLDLDVPSDTPRFALQRLRHIGVRLSRTARALGPLCRPAGRHRA